MNRRCLNCMNIFTIPAGYENTNCKCPICGFVENTPPAKVTFMYPGTILNNRYIIGTVLGSGGFGITYRAWDNTLQSIVAIKEFFPQGVANRTDGVSVSVFTSSEKEAFVNGRSRFLKEARSLAGFNSDPGTVTIHDFFEANGTAYIIMEYLDGCNMKDYVKANNKLPDIDMILRMADSVLDTLSTIHASGVVHRDISPDNIFLCKNGTFKLIDFGAVKQINMSGEKSKDVVLKAGYAPIEQYTQGGNIGPWTDIYAFAATLYKLSTGVSPQEAVTRPVEDNLQNPCLIRQELPRAMGNAIMQAMSIKIQDRFQSAASFKQALLNQTYNNVSDARTVAAPMGSYEFVGNSFSKGFTNSESSNGNSFNNEFTNKNSFNNEFANNNSFNGNKSANNSANNKSIIAIIAIAAAAVIVITGIFTIIVSSIISKNKAEYANNSDIQVSERITSEETTTEQTTSEQTVTETITYEQTTAEEVTTEVTASDLTTQASTEAASDNAGSAIPAGGQWYDGVLGCRFFVPGGFNDNSSTSETDQNTYVYYFRNESNGMYITVREEYLSYHGQNYSEEKDFYFNNPGPETVEYTYNDDDKKVFVVSGHCEEGAPLPEGPRIYYTKVKYTDSKYLMIDFNYPEANKPECDPILEKFLDDFEY